MSWKQLTPTKIGVIIGFILTLIFLFSSESTSLNPTTGFLFIVESAMWLLGGSLLGGLCGWIIKKRAAAIGFILTLIFFFSSDASPLYASSSTGHVFLFEFAGWMITGTLLGGLCGWIIKKIKNYRKKEK